jgi:hypothetical protein
MASKKTKSQPAATPAATFVAPVTVAKADRKGSSTVENPVGATWVICWNATANAGGTPPARATLHKLVWDTGVAYYTGRTQVQKFLQWFAAGQPAAGLPRGVVFPTIL